MPKAVAILEGDSSSLVKSINDAKGAMQKLEGEGRKLTDQLRDVADEADKAAGSLVNKIGGGTAIKAIAGVTAGFAAAQTALGAFSGSMQAFYSTQGEKGAKAMADIDTALSKMQGQLFTAVMGTDNLEEATQTLMSAISFLTDVVNIALAPIRGLGVLVRYLADTNIDATRAAKTNAEEQTKAAEMLLTLEANYKTTTSAISANEEKVKSLTGSTEDLRKTQLRQAISATDALAEQLKADERLREAQEIGIEVAKKKADNLRETTRSLSFDKTLVPGTEEYNRRFAELYAGLTQATINTARMAREGWSAETSAGLKALGAQRQVLAKELLGVNDMVKTSQAASTGAGRNAPAAGEPAAPELTPEQKMFAEMGAFYAEAAKKQQEAEAKAYADRIDAVVAQARAEEAAKAAELKAIEDKKLADEQAAYDARKAMALDLFQVKAKLLVQEMAIGKNGFKVMADMARKAIGDAISAKGDEAMAQAAIYAAAFNPQAIPMAAAGVAAYAAAAMLGSSSKKSASSTPASVAPVQAAPVNTSFNLRVDAAFADGESIARQFAMMQRNAQARGLVPVGA